MLSRIRLNKDKCECKCEGWIIFTPGLTQQKTSLAAMAVFQKISQPKTKTVMRIQRRSKRHRSNFPLYEDISVSEPSKKSITALSHL